MRSAIRVLALSAMAAAAFVPAAHAQDMTTYSFAGTTIYVGGGFQYLTLPDIKFTGRGKVNDDASDISDFHHQQNSDFSEYGGGAGARHRDCTRLLGRLSRHRRRQGLLVQCRQQRPPDLPPGRLHRRRSDRRHVRASDRPISSTGRAATSIIGAAPPNSSSAGRSRVYEKPNFYRNDYFIAGADIRGIDQDIKTSRQVRRQPDLHLQGDARYHLLRRLYRLRRRIQLRLHPVHRLCRKGCRRHLRSPRTAHIHQRSRRPLSADTDYAGRFAFDFFDFNSRMSKSNDDLAFIGTISLETRKQTRRAHQPVAVDRLRIHLLGSRHAICQVWRHRRGSATTTPSPPAPCCG